MKNNIERRTHIGAINRAADADTISGISAVVGEETVLWRGYHEVIEPGAFDDVLSDDVRCLFNHDSSNLLGRTQAGTCRLSITSEGHLAFENDMPDTTLGKDVRTLIDRGDVTGCSFAFTIKEGKGEYITRDNEEIYLYRIKKIGKLYDVGPVTYPAYEATSVRSAMDAAAAAKIASASQIDQDERERSISIISLQNKNFTKNEKT